MRPAAHTLPTQVQEPEGCVPLPLHACFVGTVDGPPAALAQLKLTARAAEGRTADTACGCVLKPVLDAYGHFEAQLPSGQWQLHAETADGALSATLDDLVATPRSSQGGLRLILQPRHVISGLVRGPFHDPVPDVQIVAREVDTDDEVASTESGADGRFALPELRPGLYDLQLEPPDGSLYRGVTLAKVPHDRGYIAVDLERVAILVGAVGRNEDGDCRGSEVSLIQRNGADESLEADTTTVEERCSFWFLDPQPGEVRLVLTTEDDTEIKTTVAIPATGDPPPVCLAGPCGGPPAVLTIEVVASGTPAGSARVGLGTVSWSNPDGSRHAESTFLRPGKPTIVWGFAAGTNLKVRAGGEETTLVATHPASTSCSSACPERHTVSSTTTGQWSLAFGRSHPMRGQRRPW